MTMKSSIPSRWRATAAAMPLNPAPIRATRTCWAVLVAGGVVVLLVTVAVLICSLL
jgi:hypothetical protein